jgi:acyl-CoA dehydrogenase
MAIDFVIPDDAKEVRARVRQWVQDECIPSEKRLVAGEPLDVVLGDLRKKARAQGLWLPFIPKEHGGMGLGPLANALVQMELGQSHLGALSMNSQGPDDATMLTLLAHGTDYQKEKFLKPLFNGEKRICYSMTEKAAGADATGMQTRAEKDGKGNYILNGEKWYSSSANVADIAVVMAKTNPEAPRHQQFSTFIVELPNPGTGSSEISRPWRYIRIIRKKWAQRIARLRWKTSSCRRKTYWAAKDRDLPWGSIASPMGVFAMACTMSPWRSVHSIWQPPM